MTDITSLGTFGKWHKCDEGLPRGYIDVLCELETGKHIVGFLAPRMNRPWEFVSSETGEVIKPVRWRAIEV